MSILTLVFLELSAAFDIVYLNFLLSFLRVFRAPLWIEFKTAAAEPLYEV